MAAVNVVYSSPGPTHAVASGLHPSVGSGAGEAVVVGEGVGPGDAVRMGEGVGDGDAVDVGEGVGFGRPVGQSVGGPGRDADGGPSEGAPPGPASGAHPPGTTATNATTRGRNTDSRMRRVKQIGRARGTAEAVLWITVRRALDGILVSARVRLAQRPPPDPRARHPSMTRTSTGWWSEPSGVTKL